MRDHPIIFAVCRRCGAPFRTKLSSVINGGARTCGWDCPARPARPLCEYCGRPFRRRGRTKYHAAARWCDWDCFRASGDLREPHLDLVQRVWSRVHKTDDCWEWTGYIGPQGYGSISIRGQTALAHRAVWQLTRGPIPDGLFVCHTCDNRPCVRPDHLFLGTAADNARDCVSKGRSGGPHKKLTPELIRTIRARHAAGGVTQRALAAEYGLSETHVSRLIRGSTHPDL